MHSDEIWRYAGVRMLQDKDFIQKTRSLILSERERILNELNSFRYAKTYPAYANFILVKILRDDLTSFDIFDRAIRQGMMIRDCSSFEGLRIHPFLHHALKITQDVSLSC